VSATTAAAAAAARSKTFDYFNDNVANSRSRGNCQQKLIFLLFSVIFVLLLPSGAFLVQKTEKK